MADLVYNIVPVDDISAATDHPAVQFPEVSCERLLLKPLLICLRINLVAFWKYANGFLGDEIRCR